MRKGGFKYIIINDFCKIWKHDRWGDAEDTEITVEYNALSACGGAVMKR